MEDFMLFLVSMAIATPADSSSGECALMGIQQPYNFLKGTL